MASLCETPELTPSPLGSCISSRRESQVSELHSVPESTDDEQAHAFHTALPSKSFKKPNKGRHSVTRFLLPTVPSREPSLQPSTSRRSWLSQLPSSVSSRDPSRFSFASVLGGPDENEAVARLAAAGVRVSNVSILTPSEPDGILRFPSLLTSARLQVWLFLEEPFGSLGASFVSVLMVMIIFSSIAHGVFVFEKTSMSSAFQEEEASLATSASELIDMIFNLIFCADLAMRLWAFPLRARFFTQPKNAIDTICILPFLINEALALPIRLPALNFLRWFSAYEAYLRLLKLARYFWGWQLLFRAIWDSAKALVIPLYFLILIVVLGSCTLFVFEASESKGHKNDESYIDGVAKQACDADDEFCDIVTITNLPDAIHFCTICILSMSTGPFYGMQANSWGGQATVCALMVLGMTFMAMPISIVGNCFAQTWFDQDRIVLLDKLRSRLAAQGSTPEDLRDVFDEVDADGSGAIDLGDFQDMIAACHLHLSNVKTRKLFREFDIDGDGVVNFSDFSMTIYPDLPLEEVNVQFDQAGNVADNIDRDSQVDSCRKSQFLGRLQPPRVSAGSARSSGKVSTTSSCRSVHATASTKGVKLWGGSKADRPTRSKKQPKFGENLTNDFDGASASSPALNTSTVPTVRVLPDSHARSEDESAEYISGLNSNLLQACEASRSSFRSMRSENSSYRPDQFELHPRPADGPIGRLEVVFGSMIQRFERRIDSLAQSLTQPLGPSAAVYGHM